MTSRSIASALACAATLTAVAGCAPNTLPPPEGSAASASPTTGGPVGGPPEPKLIGNTAPHNTATRFTCNNGDTITARYPDTDHAIVHYQDSNLPMHSAVSANGARYVGNDYEWWTHGTRYAAEATLFTHNDDGSTGDKITLCYEQ